MKNYQYDEKYLNEIWRRVKIKEYDKAQLEKIKENKRILRRLQFRWLCLIFGLPTVLILVLYFKFDRGIVFLTVSTLIFLISSQLYEYFLFKEIKRRIYYEY